MMATLWNNCVQVCAGALMLVLEPFLKTVLLRFDVWNNWSEVGAGALRLVLKACCVCLNILLETYFTLLKCLKTWWQMFETIVFNWAAGALRLHLELQVEACQKKLRFVCGALSYFTLSNW